MTPPDARDPNAGWLGLTRASLVVLAPLMILLGLVALIWLAGAVWPTPPTLNAITTDRMSVNGRSQEFADTTGWSGYDKRALVDATDADVRRLLEAWADGTSTGTNRTRPIPIDDSLSWSSLERSHGAEMQARGLSRDTTLHPFPAGSASRAALWTYHDWAGHSAASALALIDVPRPSTGERVRFVVEVWSEPQD